MPQRLSTYLEHSLQDFQVAFYNFSALLAGLSEDGVVTPPVSDDSGIPATGLIFDGAPGTTATYRLLDLKIMGRETVGNDEPQPFAHGGAWLGRDQVPIKKVEINLLVKAYTPEHLGEALDQLLTLWRPNAPGEGSLSGATRQYKLDEALLMMRMPGQSDRFLQGRPRKVAVNNKSWGTGTAEVTLEFIGSTPGFLGNDYQYEDIYPAEDLGGLTFDVTFPVTFAPSGNPSALAFLTGGNWAPAWVIHLRGPLTNPVVTCLTTGQVFRFNRSINNGTSVIIDGRDRSVYGYSSASEAAANRFAWLDEAEWFTLAPWRDYTFSLTSEDSGDTGYARLSIWNQYI